MTSSNSNHINVNSLVLDAAPLLNGTRLDQLPVTEYYTVPEVISEVKDARSRENLARQMQLIDLKQKNPSEDSMNKVIAFAKKTGDFAVLSLTDLKVIALAVTLEMEKNGGQHLRTVPAGTPSSTNNIKVISGGRTLGYKPNAKKETKEDADEEKSSSSDTDLEQVTQSMDSISFEQAGNATDEAAERQEPVETKLSEEPEVSTEPQVSTEPMESDDSEGWITPKNVARYKAKEFGHSGSSTSSPNIEVAVMSSDFALQNVLMQMNVKLLSPESGGMLINKLKNWVLRCHACLHITTDMSKKFCPACGNHGTLLRASTQVDSKTGQMKVFLKENFRYNTRGTQYSVPIPKGGRKNNDLILREDQPEYQRAQKKYERSVTKQARNPSNPFDPDYIPAILIDQTGKKQHSNRVEAPVIGYGKKNPNEARKKRK